MEINILVEFVVNNFTSVIIKLYIKCFLPVKFKNTHIFNQVEINAFPTQKTFFHQLTRFHLYFIKKYKNFFFSKYSRKKKTFFSTRFHFYLSKVDVDDIEKLENTSTSS